MSLFWTGSLSPFPVAISKNFRPRFTRVSMLFLHFFTLICHHAKDKVGINPLRSTVKVVKKLVNCQKFTKNWYLEKKKTEKLYQSEELTNMNSKSPKRNFNAKNLKFFIYCLYHFLSNWQTNKHECKSSLHLTWINYEHLNSKKNNWNFKKKKT